MKSKIFLAFIAAGFASPLIVSGQAQTPQAPLKNAPPSASPLAAGKAVYDQHCTACHGENGDGNGPASVWLFPRPRNFSAGQFKIKSTPGIALPTDDDLFRTLTRGMPGSSMPSFTYLSEPERGDAVQYVKHLTAYVDESGHRINRFEDARSKGELARPIAVPPEPPVTVQSLAQGAQVFSKMLCMTCHGETGAGDGPNAPTLKDTQGLYLPPRDFNTGSFRGGHTGRDLYLRVATGLAGTPMVPFGNEVMTDQERWSVVHYVQSLRRKETEIHDILAPTDGVIRAPRIRKQLPSDPADPFWESMDPTRIALNPLWPEKDLIYAVAVRAVHDGKRLAIFCTWRDPIANGAPVRMQDFERPHTVPGHGRREQSRQPLAMESRLAAGGRGAPARRARLVRLHARGHLLRHELSHRRGRGQRARAAARFAGGGRQCARLRHDDRAAALRAERERPGRVA